MMLEVREDEDNIEYDAKTGQPSLVDNSSGDNSQFSSNESKMKEFIDTHGIKMQIPALYVRDCKVYPGNPKYMFQIINHCLP